MFLLVGGEAAGHEAQFELSSHEGSWLGTEHLQYDYDETMLLLV